MPIRLGALFIAVVLIGFSPAVARAQDPKPPESPPADPAKPPTPEKPADKPSPPPAPDRVLIDKVRALVAKNEVEPALRDADSLWTQYPKSRYAGEALFIAGELLYATDRFYEAHLRYRRLLENHQGFKRLGAVIRREFEIGMAFIREKKFTTWLGIEVSAAGLGREILSHLVKHYEQDDFDDAMYQISEYWFAKHSWERAAEQYERLIEEYPESEWVPAARFKVAMTHLNRSQGYNHDLWPVHTAEKLLKEYLQDYPAGGLVAEAERKLDAIRESLAKRDLEIGEFYLDREKPLSAAIYYDAILRERPLTRSAPIALAKLTHIADSAPPKAARFARRVVRRWHQDQGRGPKE